MFGWIGDALGMIVSNDMAEDSARQQQGFAAGESAAHRAFQERMRATQYQTAVGDMKAAGLNPMLAYHHGGAGTPVGSAASGAAAQTPHMPPSSAGMQTAAQIHLLESLARKTDAEADEARERTRNYDPQRREIEARIPRHQADVEHIKQQIGESATRIEKMWEEIRVMGFSAAQIQQQTKNLQEMVHQIRANVGHLRALAAKESAATDEIKQRVRQDLPAMEKILMNLERIREEMAQPGHANQERAADSLAGQIGAYLRQLGGLPSAIVTRRGAATINRGPTTIHNHGN